MSDRSLRETLHIRSHTRAWEKYWSHYDRNSYVCPSCGYEAQGIDREFHVHHKDRDWLNNHIFNLVALCVPCHRVAHRAPRRKRAMDAWKEGFLALGEESGDETDKGHLHIPTSGLSVRQGAES